MVLGQGDSVVKIVIKGVDEFSKTLKSAQKEVSGLNKVSSSFVKVGAAFTATGVAGGIALGKLAKSASKGIAIQKGFNNMFGKQSVTALKDLKSATKGAVSEVDLMRQANQAMLLGIDPNALPDMFKGAAAAANAVGRDVGDAITDITTGIGRQSKLILDNLGIVVDSQKAYDDYAKSINKASSELSAQERKTAFTNATLIALKENAEKVGDATSDAALATQRASAAWADAKQALGTTLQEPLIKVAEKTTEVVEGFNDLTIKEKEVIGKSALLGTGLLTVGGASLLMLGSIGKASTGLQVLGAALGVGGAATAAGTMTAAVVGTGASMKILTSVNKDLRRIMISTMPHAFGLAGAILNVKDGLLKAIESEKLFSESLNSTRDAAFDNVDSLQGMFKAINETNTALLVTDPAADNAATSIDGVGTASANAQQKVRDLVTALMDVARVGVFVGGGLDFEQVNRLSQGMSNAAARNSLSQARGLATRLARDEGLGVIRANFEGRMAREMAGQGAFTQFQNQPNRDSILRQVGRDVRSRQRGLNPSFNQPSFNQPSFNKGFESFGNTVRGFTLSSNQFGGIVSRPTLSTLGETGPEKILPLNKPSIGGSGMGSININIGTITGVGLTIDELTDAFQERLRTMISA